MSEGRLLNPDERFSALRTLLEHEPSLRRLTAYARSQSRKLRGGRDANELVNEAAVRIFDEKRESWPSDVSAMVYVCGVIRSIASEWQKPPIVPPHLEPQATMSPAELSAMLSDILDSFSDDPVAQQLFVGICEGVEGEKLRLELSLSPTEYATKRRRVRRRLSSMFRDWK